MVAIRGSSGHFSWKAGMRYSHVKWRLGWIVTIFLLAGCLSAERGTEPENDVLLIDVLGLAEFARAGLLAPLDGLFAPGE